MPRKSQAALSVISPASGFTRLRPPSTMTEAERAVFIEIVNTCDTKHFKKSDTPLLVAYCQIILLLQQAAKELRKCVVYEGKTSPWVGIQERAIKSMVALSMRLRLSPQARAPNNPTRPQKPPSVYEELRDDDD